MPALTQEEINQLRKGGNRKDADYLQSLLDDYYKKRNDLKELRAGVEAIFSGKPFHMTEEEAEEINKKLAERV